MNAISDIQMKVQIDSEDDMAAVGRQLPKDSSSSKNWLLTASSPGR